MGSITSTAATEICNGDLANADGQHISSTNLPDESQLPNIEGNTQHSQSNEPNTTLNAAINQSVEYNPLENANEPLKPQFQASNETANLVNNSGADTTNGSGCAIDVQPDDEYDYEENEDEMSETVALTQKFGKNRIMKN